MFQNIYNSDIPIIVVPEGLAVHNKKVLAEPSFIYRKVLDYVISTYPKYKIFLAPANDFGSRSTEQAVAEKYLKSHNIQNLITVPSIGKNYIDTLGNSKQLKEYLIQNNKWPLPPAILVIAKLHAKRAELCFKSCGFKILKVDSIDYHIPKNEYIVKRLWYYKYPFFHKIYEKLALLRDLLRITLWKR